MGVTIIYSHLCDQCTQFSQDDTISYKNNRNFYAELSSESILKRRYGKPLLYKTLTMHRTFAGPIQLHGTWQLYRILVTLTPVSST
jgi:hypothetical protein